MLIPFFFALREGGLKTSVTELLCLLEGLERGLASCRIEDFYYLSRAALVKDESQLDRFDRIFSAYFRGVEDSLSDLSGEIPDEWLRRQAELVLSPEEQARIEALGGFEETHGPLPSTPARSSRTSSPASRRAPASRRRWRAPSGSWD